MTFLAPMAGLVAAGLAVPALLAMYFLKLRRRPMRVSSTLLWQSAVRDLEVNSPWRWLRASLLLLLHLLLVGALCAAIGRPVLDGDWDADGAQRVILAIDCSASMNAAVDPPGGANEGSARTRLDAAKDRAIELIDSLASSPGTASGERPKIMVVAVAGSGGGTKIVGGFTASPGAARDAVRAVTPTDQPNAAPADARDAGGFAVLADIVRAQSGESTEEPSATGEDRPPPVRVVVLTDGGLFDGLAPPAVTLPGGAHLTIIGVPGVDPAARSTPHNIGIVALSARREYDNPALVRVFARLVSDAPQPRRVLAECRVDGEPAQARAVELPPADPQDPERRLGEAGVTFELTMGVVGAAGGNAASKVVTLSLAGDAGGLLKADDSASLVMSPAVKPRVLVVAGEGDGRANVFLLGVLEAMELGSLRVVDARAYAQLLAGAAMEAAGPRARAIAYDLVIFDRAVGLSLPHGVPSISFGGVAGLPGVTVEQSGDYAGRVVTWKRSHPAMQGVSLDDVVVRGVPRVVISDDAEPTARGAGVRDVEVLATIAAPGSSAAGPLVVACQYAGARRVVVACDLELATTNWGTLVSLPIFVAGMTDALTQRAEADAGRFFTTAQAVMLHGDGGEGAEVTLEGPLGASDTERVVLAAPVRAADDGGAGVASFGVVGRAGVYRAGSDGSLTEALVAVNLLSEPESDLRGRASMSMLQGPMVEHRRDARGESRGAWGGEPRGRGVLGRKELWPWLVGLAVVLMCIEWMVYAWRLRV